MNRFLASLLFVFYLTAIFFFLSTLALAQNIQTLGTFKTASCVTLKQTCSNCTFVNLSVSTPPNQTAIVVNQSMTRQTVNLWTYSFCNTTNNGEYIYDTFGDLNGNTESSS